MLAGKLRTASSSDPAWNVANAVYLQNFYIAPSTTNSSGLFFKPDGLKMYVIEINSDVLIEYDLSTAWNVTTASYLQNRSVAAQDTAPLGVFFKPDGLKMYVMGRGTYKVYEYDLSTAWDISTASYLQDFSVLAQENQPQGVFFKPDGLKMYVLGRSGDDVNEYDLSTAWNVTTASYLQRFYIGAQETAPEGLFFKPDGLKMYVIGESSDAVNEYVLSTAWDVTTASYLQNFSVAAQENQPVDLFFKPDGLKMYVLGLSSDAINEYNLV